MGWLFAEVVQVTPVCGVFPQACHVLGGDVLIALYALLAGAYSGWRG